MIRRKRRASHSNHERWLVSYADFITLLFASCRALRLVASRQEKSGKAGVGHSGRLQEMES